MRMDVAAQTDIGRRKKTNEDFYGVFRDDLPDVKLFSKGALLMVADGLGGHVGGEIASKLAVNTAKDMLKESMDPPQDPDDEPTPFGAMRKWFVRANENVWQTNQELVRAGKPMGTTLVAMLLTPRKAFITNVGDSRCYHIRDGQILEKTEDHSWVDEQVKLGLMSRSEAETDSRRNYVTRSIGTHPEVGIDTYTWHVVAGDWLLLCTDGLVNMVKDSEIKEVFRKPATAAEIAHTLVTMANDNGGRDNITVVVANVQPSRFRITRLRLRQFFRKKGGKMLLVLLFLLYGALCFVGGYYVRHAGLLP